MIVIFFFLFLCGSVKLPLITDYSLRFENFCCRAAFCCNLVTMKIWTNCDVRNKLKPGKKSFFGVCCCPWNVNLMKQLCAQKYYIFTGCCIHTANIWLPTIQLWLLVWSPNFNFLISENKCNKNNTDARKMYLISHNKIRGPI